MLSVSQRREAEILGGFTRVTIIIGPRPLVAGRVQARGWGRRKVKFGGLGWANGWMGWISVLEKPGCRPTAENAKEKKKTWEQLSLAGPCTRRLTDDTRAPPKFGGCKRVELN